MRNFTLIVIVLLASITSNAQFGFKSSDFTYGNLIGEKDTIAGYFFFSKELSSMGQRIYKWEENKSSSYKTYWAKDYLRFEGGSRYLEKFPIKGAGGTYHIMLERLEDGKFQLFEFGFMSGPANLIRMQHFYFLKGYGVSMKLQRKEFKKVMQHLLADDPALVEKLKNGELGFNDMQVIIQQYNANAATVH